MSDVKQYFRVIAKGNYSFLVCKMVQLNFDGAITFKFCIFFNALIQYFFVKLLLGRQNDRQ